MCVVPTCQDQVQVRWLNSSARGPTTFRHTFPLHSDSLHTFICLCIVRNIWWFAHKREKLKMTQCFSSFGYILVRALTIKTNAVRVLREEPALLCTHLWVRRSCRSPWKVLSSPWCIRKTYLGITWILARLPSCSNNLDARFGEFDDLN